MINDSNFRQISYMVDSYIPQFILDEYPNFKQFLETYYEWCQQNGKFVPWNVLRNIQNWNDVDNTIDEFINYFKKEYIDLPELDSWDLYIKHYKEIYSSKGSTKALEFFIKLLTGLNTTVEYPNRYLMKSSDGVYRSYKVIYCQRDNSIDYSSYISTTIKGSVSLASGIIENIELYDGYIKVFLSHTVGKFIDEDIYFDNGQRFSTHIIKTINDFEIVNGGNNYQVGEVVSSLRYPGVKAKIESVYTGRLDDIIIDNAGTGYMVGDVINVECACTLEYFSMPVLRVSEVDENGSITRIKVLYDGYGLLSIPYVTDIQSENGSGAEVTLVSNKAGAIRKIIITNPECNLEPSYFSIDTEYGINAEIYPVYDYEYQEIPYYFKSGSFLSDIFKLQDSYYYQEYSYVLNIAGSLLEKYRDLFKNILHPAGFAFFTNTILENIVYLHKYYIDSTLDTVLDEDIFKYNIRNYVELLHYSDRIINDNILWRNKKTVLDDIKNRQLSSFKHVGGKFINSSLEIGTGMYTFTINPTPSDATVVLTASGYTQVGNSIIVPYGTTVNWSVSKTGYVTQSGIEAVTTNTTKSITLSNVTYTLTINPTPNDATVTLTAPGYTQEGNSITVVTGTQVSWSVSKTDYITQSGTETVTSTTTKTVTLDRELFTFTITPTPNDATVLLTATGYTQTGNNIKVPKNTTVNWSVSKTDYISQSGNYTVTENYTLPITLQPDVPTSEDYEYTVQGDNTAILTKYIGTNPVVIGPDYVKGDL